MKVALLNDRIPPEGMGGAEAVVWRLARGLQAEGHEVHVVATTPRESFEEIRSGIKTYHIHAAYPERFRAWLSLWNPQTVAALRRLLRRLQPDVLNAHNIHHYLSYHALKVAQDLGIATVFSSHDVMPFAYGKLRHFVRENAQETRLPQDYRLPPGYNLRQNRLRYNPWRNQIIRHYLKSYADLRTVPSQALADAFRANDLPSTEVVHNGIDPSEWARPDDAVMSALQDRLGLAGMRVILIAGRLTADKGTVQLLAAMDQLKESLPRMRLLVLSARDISQQIPERYRHLRPLICSAGWLSGEELRAAYHLADIVAVPSVVFDTFPTVNLEAMSAGNAVVASCFGGSAEAVVDGETGFIINPLDTPSFCGRLRILFEDDSLRREMGQRGQERIHESFTLQRQVRQMVDIFERARAKPN